MLSDAATKYLPGNRFFGYVIYEEKVSYLGCVIKKKLLLNSVWLVLTPRIYQCISFEKILLNILFPTRGLF